MDNAQAIAIVEDAVKNLGFDRISPESLEALGDAIRADKDMGLSVYDVRRAYRVVMAGFRAMFAPA